MDRRDKLLSGLNLATDRGAEIGPLCRPTVTKSQGNIIYVDHAETETLRRKYANAPNVETEKIVEVDAVWGGLTLDKCLNGSKVDYVIASHVIEHVPDLISWLEEIESILNPGGTLRLVVPDRRFTFDYLRRESRLCDIVNAYVLRARTPLPIAILDHFISVRRVDVQAAWNGTLPAELPMIPGHGVDGGIGLARDQIANGTYHDVHCWVFTPRSMMELFTQAATEGLIRFACERFYDTEPGELEFVVVLRHSADREEASESWIRAARQLHRLGTGTENRPTDASVQDWSSEEITELRLTLSQREAELCAARDTLSGVLGSRSWRVTRPLRSLRRLFRD